MDLKWSRTCVQTTFDSASGCNICQDDFPRCSQDVSGQAMYRCPALDQCTPLKIKMAVCMLDFLPGLRKFSLSIQILSFHTNVTQIHHQLILQFSET